MPPKKWPNAWGGWPNGISTDMKWNRRSYIAYSTLVCAWIIFGIRKDLLLFTTLNLLWNYIIPCQQTHRRAYNLIVITCLSQIAPQHHTPILTLYYANNAMLSPANTGAPHQTSPVHVLYDWSTFIIMITTTTKASTSNTQHIVRKQVTQMRWQRPQ